MIVPCYNPVHRDGSANRKGSLHGAETRTHVCIIGFQAVQSLSIRSAPLRSPTLPNCMPISPDLACHFVPSHQIVTGTASPLPTRSHSYCFSRATVVLQRTYSSVLELQNSFGSLVHNRISKDLHRRGYGHFAVVDPCSHDHTRELGINWRGFQA